MHPPGSAHAEVSVKTNFVGRIWLGLLVVLTLLSRHAPDDPPVLFTDMAEPIPPGQPTLIELIEQLLDKVGDFVGRAWCWAEAKLGLHAKEWPQA